MNCQVSLKREKHYKANSISICPLTILSAFKKFIGTEHLSYHSEVPLFTFSLQYKPLTPSTSARALVVIQQ